VAIGREMALNAGAGNGDGPEVAASSPPELNQRGVGPDKVCNRHAHHVGTAPRTQEVRSMAWHIARQQELVPLARELGRAVARGLLPLPTARSVLLAKHPDCPVGLSVSSGMALHDSVRDTERALARQEGLVRWRVWPLAEERKPGREIMHAARNVDGPMRDWELADLCVEIVRSVRNRRTRHV
jgi:hypothetical protein